MLVGGGKHFVIEIMEQADQSPFILVGIGRAVTSGASAHRCFDRQSVLAQAVALGVFAQ